MSNSEAARARWSRIVAAQRGSGLSVARFCEERGIAASSLFAWRRELVAGGPTARPRGFVEALVFGADGGHGAGAGAAGGAGGWAGVAIELAGGRRVIVDRGFDRRVLLDVLDALESGGERAADGARA